MKLWYFLVLVCLFSCSNLETDNPNEPTNVPASTLFTQSQVELFNNLHGRTYNAEWTMLLSQYLTQHIYLFESLYRVNQGQFDRYFQSLYASVLNELSEARRIIESSDKVVGNVKVNQLALTEIMSIYTFTILTEAYGAIPYSEALSEDILFPKYDEQSFIYLDLMSRLSIAIESLEEQSGSYSEADVIYNGDVSKWKKLGGSILLRMALRVADIDIELANDYVDKALEFGLILNNEDNAIYTFGDDPEIANPFYIDYVVNDRDDFSLTTIFIDQLIARNDPRLEVFATQNGGGNYVGIQYGVYESGVAKDSFSRPLGIRNFNSPHIIMDYAEVSFNLCEAAQRGLISGSAIDYYSEGITASMNFWGINDDELISEYITQNSYDNNNWKRSIGVQKWIAFYGNGHQSWTEWRRLDFPELVPPEDANTPTIPVRLPYPYSEQINNGEQLDAITNDPTDMISKLWFDRN